MSSLEVPPGSIVVSTHLDDAVFLAWTVIAGAEEVTVVTVYTGGPNDDRTTIWDADTGVISRERIRQREAENEAALALAGARAVNLGLVEGVYDGVPVEPDDLRDTLAGAARLFVPAGVGIDHINPEHVRVRDVCLALHPRATLYADNPYSLFRDDLDLPAELGSPFERRVVALDAEQRRMKAAAIGCYAGELKKLEGTFGPLTEPDRLAYEVLWEPRAV